LKTNIVEVAVGSMTVLNIARGQACVLDDGLCENEASRVLGEANGGNTWNKNG
jgi:hypothetical protein